MSTDNVDLAALIRDRKQKSQRATVKIAVCLDDDLMADLDAAQAEQDDARAEAELEGNGDTRLAGGTALQRRIRELSERVAAASVIVAFRVPTRDESQAILERAQAAGRAEAKLKEAGDESDSELVEAAKFDMNEALLAECFWRFERNGEAVDELDAQSWADLWPTLAPGEQGSIADQIWAKTTGRPDFPKSAKQLLLTRK